MFLIKKIQVFLLVLWLGFIMIPMSACSQTDSGLEDTNGNIIQKSQLANKWVIINYWADWCGYCVHEVPELNKFYQHQNNKNIVLLGVNYDNLPLPLLKQAMQKMNILFPVLVTNPNTFWPLGDVDGLPTTFVINPQGQIIKKLVGSISEADLLKIVTSSSP